MVACPQQISNVFSGLKAERFPLQEADVPGSLLVAFLIFGWSIAIDHALNGLRGVWLAVFVDVTSIYEIGADLS